MVSLVVAYASNRVIGSDGTLPWHLPADMRRFKELTSGHAVLMGRRTFESLPDAFRPLPNRRNVVLSRSPGYSPAGVEVFPDMRSAVDACGGECFVIGGATVYQQALPFADRVYATEIERDFEGDTFFPDLPQRQWRRVERSERIVENGVPFSFAVYERVAPDAVPCGTPRGGTRGSGTPGDDAPGHEGTAPKD